MSAMESSATIVRRTYRYTHPDGSTSCETVLRCPHQGCEVECADVQGLASHTSQAHGFQLGEPVSCTGNSTRTTADLPNASQKVTRLRLPDGEVRLVCPHCQQQFPADEATFLKHIAETWTWKPIGYPFGPFLGSGFIKVPLRTMPKKGTVPLL